MAADGGSASLGSSARDANTASLVRRLVRATLTKHGAGATPDADVDRLLDDVSCPFLTRARCDDASRAVDAILSPGLTRAVRIERLRVDHETIEMSYRACLVSPARAPTRALVPRPRDIGLGRNVFDVRAFHSLIAESRNRDQRMVSAVSADKGCFV